MTYRRRVALIAVALFLLNVGLNVPLFVRGDAPYRDSIEGGYRGMSRFIAEHPNPWGWSPLQYAGLPTQFVYLPSLHYASAGVSWVTGIPPGYAYKLITATAACAMPAVMFLFVLAFTRSVIWSAAAALGVTFFSPLYGLIPQVDKDRGMVYLPWRMHVFAKYGEGPHIAGLTLIPIALLALRGVAAKQSFWLTPIAAALMACIALTNWVAALALALCCLTYLLAVWRRPEESLSLWRVAGAGALAYAYACFWLTPTFVHTIAFNWPLDAFNYKLQQMQRVLLVLWVGGTFGLWAFVRWLRWPVYPTFVALALFVFGMPVLVFYSYGIDVLPESRRYAPEFELFLVLAVFAFFHFALTRPNGVRLVCAAAVAIPLSGVAWKQAATYVGQGHSKWWPIPRERTTEYQVAKWINDRKPQGRVLASGGLRFRVNSWFDLQQVGGAFESGLRNRVPVGLAYQIRTSIGSTPESDAADSIEQMTAMGVEYVVIHGPKSAEHYRDYRNPMKFEGVLERVHSAQDDYVYRVPFRSLAHLVKAEEHPAYPVKGFIRSFVAALQDSSRRTLETRWLGPEAIEVRGPVPQGFDVTLLVTHDDGWVATQDGNPVAIDKNKLNYMVVKTRPATASVVRLDYRGVPEQRLFFLISLAAVTGTAWRVYKRRRV